VQFGATYEGRKPHLKIVERLTEINKLRKVGSCWLYFENRATNFTNALLFIFSLQNFHKNLYLCNRIHGVTFQKSALLFLSVVVI